jgi:GNAT superfamily N-acetyltransferase
MATSFCSERLIYRAAEETAQDKAFILSLQNDRASAEQTTGYLVKPMSATDVNGFLRNLQGSLLGVLICLPISPNSLITSPIGYISVKSTSQPHHRNATMSIQICREEQGKGYGSEAIKWVLEWGFLAAGLHRVSNACFSFNEGARRLYERMGFVVEGRTREVIWKNGGWYDSITMGILEGEWREKYLTNEKGAFTLIEGEAKK